MLGNDTTQVLQNITQITNSAIIEWPKMTIQNTSQDILGIIDLEILGEKEFEEFGIYDLTSFLNAISILDEPEISRDGALIIAKDTDSSIQFLTTHVSACEDFTTNPAKITSTVAAPSLIEAKIDTLLTAKIKKGVNLFKTLKDVFIVKDDTGVYIRTGNKSNFNKTENAYKIKLDAEIISDKNFEIAIPAENFLKLPPVDYTLKVKYNETADAYRLTAENAVYQFVLSMKV